MRRIGLVIVGLVLMVSHGCSTVDASIPPSGCQVLEMTVWEMNEGTASYVLRHGNRVAVPGGWIYSMTGIKGPGLSWADNIATPVFVPDPKSPCK